MASETRDRCKASGRTQKQAAEAGLPLPLESPHMFHASWLLLLPLPPCCRCAASAAQTCGNERGSRVRPSRGGAGTTGKAEWAAAGLACLWLPFQCSSWQAQEQSAARQSRMEKWARQQAHGAGVGSAWEEQDSQGAALTCDGPALAAALEEISRLPAAAAKQAAQLLALGGGSAHRQGQGGRNGVTGAPGPGGACLDGPPILCQLLASPQRGRQPGFGQALVVLAACQQPPHFR